MQKKEKEYNMWKSVHNCCKFNIVKWEKKKKSNTIMLNNFYLLSRIKSIKLTFSTGWPVCFANLL